MLELRAIIAQLPPTNPFAYLGICRRITLVVLLIVPPPLGPLNWIVVASPSVISPLEAKPEKGAQFARGHYQLLCSEDDRYGKS
jgi:hypothetical protein